MTPKTLFNIILKVIGIFFIGDVIVSIPQLTNVIPYFVGGRWEEGIPLMLIALATLSVVIAVPYFLIFKSNLIIEKLRLDKGFDDENIQLNVQLSTVLSISIIVLGGLILKDEIPYFLKELYTFFQMKVSAYAAIDTDLYYFISSGVKIIIGFLLINNHRQITNWIVKRQKN